jgi:hypothetical protein
VNVGDPTRPDEPVVEDGAGSLVSRAEQRNDKRPSSLPSSALGILLVVTIAAAELGLKKRLRRRVIPNP